MPQWNTKIIVLNRILVDMNNDMTHTIKRIKESKTKIPDSSMERLQSKVVFGIHGVQHQIQII